ncbi:ferredoxin [Hyphomonas johnsonii]|uniref:Ferredoxin n=1 Tax=Hyphomonas johnsonii MHS-2 TaxID=1280950 RepID=A0A059FU88_9PROT|nr:ferredoxin [Hyphomonas johnsonii]KCZ94244.1 ferredoxin [Hyphomonas johnsonii MHS-2]
MAIKVTVNVEGCVGHARCEAVAPEVYQLNDDGFNVTPCKYVSDNLKEQAIRGARACPEQVITVEEVDDSEADSADT